MCRTLSTKNRIVVASAGSRKTTLIVEEALLLSAQRVLITTYTNENVAQIRSYLIQRCGHVPKHISLVSWFSFLLQDGVRPYQSFVTQQRRIDSILFGTLPAIAKYASKNELEKYYVTTSGNVYSDRVADFVCTSDERSGGLVVKRLEKVYDHIFIDETQDMAGYDLMLLERLFRSLIPVTCVGDPRQATFSTNKSAKYRRYKRSGIYEWVIRLKDAGLISMEERNQCYRCNQLICDFADRLFPDYAKTKSMNGEVTGHDGVFLLKPGQVADYAKRHRPVVLRWNKNTDTMGLSALNIGMSKGRTYERVLIFPTTPMKAYLETMDVMQAGDLSKLYVAVTRARSSVAFVVS